MTRREFLSYSAMAGVVGAIGVSPILSACAGGKKKNAYEPLRAEGEYYVPDLPDKAVAGRELKAGVIGCGGSRREFSGCCRRRDDYGDRRCLPRPGPEP